MSATSALPPTAPSTGGKALTGSRRRLVLAATTWAVLIFLVAAATMPPTLGYGVLYFAAVPLVLSVVVAALLSVRGRAGQRTGRTAAAALCGLILLAVGTSFVAVSFLMVPTVVLLFAATVRPASAYR